MTADTTTAKRPVWKTNLTRHDLYTYSPSWIYLGTATFFGSMFIALENYFGWPVSWGFIAIVLGGVAIGAGYKWAPTIRLEMVGFASGMFLILLGLFMSMLELFGDKPAVAIIFPLLGMAMALYGWRSRVVANRPVD